MIKYIASDNQVLKINFLCVKTRRKFIVFEKLECNLQYIYIYIAM
jgi:hypothetical protein